MDNIKYLREPNKNIPATGEGFELIELGKLIKFPVIDRIIVCNNGMVVEELSEDIELVQSSALDGCSPKDFFVLRVSDDSMYPQLCVGNRALVQRCKSVDIGKIAVVLRDIGAATFKRITEDSDLEQCRILGKAIQVAVDIN